jgi:hypothetical protein
MPGGVRLVAVCLALVAGESFLLVRAHAGSAMALAPQIAAPAPWGVFHDERWIFTFASTWPELIGSLLAMVLGRGALTAVMVKAAWPSALTGTPALSWRKAFVRGCSSTAVAALLLSPCSSLLVAFGLAPISDLWLAAIPAALGIAIFVHHGPVDCWWLRHPRLRSIGWVLLSYLELTVAGAVLVSAPRQWTPLVVVVAGLADAWAWRGLVRALARPARWRLAPVSPLGLAGVVAVTVLCVGAAATPSSSAALLPPKPRAGASAGAPVGATATAPPEKQADPRPVLLVSGYGVRWEGNVPSLGPGFAATEFSYQGLTSDGWPLAYGSAATQQALPVLLSRFRTQVADLARRAGHNIDIVGESEGSLLATIYLLTTPHPPVDHVVLLSPLVRPAGAGYPAAGHTGAGLAAAWELRGIANATTALTPLHVSANSPFIQSLANHANALHGIFGCPVAGVQQFAVLPLADSVGVPAGAMAGIPHETVSALHGTLLVNPNVRYDVARYLSGASTPGTRDSALTKAVEAASAAWQVPPRHLRADGPAQQRCAAATEALRSWLG